MKKTAVLIALVLLLLGAFTLCVSAQIVDSGDCGDNLTWMLDDAGTLTISGTGAMTSSPWREEYKNQIVTLKIENGVTNIGMYAFNGCKELTSVTIPNSVTSIDYAAFYNCTGLTSIMIPNSVTSIGESAFFGCAGLKSLTIPNSVTSISNSAFSSCFGLETISVSDGNPNYVSANNCLIERSSKTLVLGCKNSVIPADGSVTSIGRNAFWYCSGLTSVTIPNGVTCIGQHAFLECTGLTSITISNSVTSIDWNAFGGCTGLTSITIPNSVTIISEEVFSGCTGLTSITIPDSIESIQYGAFAGCTGLTDITIPNSVTGIGEFAFKGCTGLTSIKIPNSVTSIGSDAFHDCTGLKAVTISDSLMCIENSVFWGCTGLTSITIPNSIESIEYSAFAGCIGLTSIVIPNSVMRIDNTAFKSCSGLETISVSDGNPNYVSVNNCLIKSASKTLILGCKNSVIPADGSVTSIGCYAFSGCTGLTSVTIPNKVTRIEGFAFEDCTGLKSVTIPNSVTSIDYGVFRGCTGLTNVTIPNSIARIELYMFYGCTGLKSVTIPNSVKSIGDYAFFGCTGMTSVYFTGSEKDWISKEIGTFNDCLQNAKIHYNYDPVTGHAYKNVVTKATLSKDGKIVPTCTICGATKTATKIAKASKISISKTKFVYNGKVQKPTLTVKDSAGKAIDSKYYTVKWSNASSKAVGSYTEKITFKGNYSGSKTLSYTIVPKAVTGVKNAAPETKSIKLSWTKVTGAKYYEVYGSTDNKTFKKITTVSATTAKITKVNDKALAAGKTYYFKVRAMDSTKKLIGAYSKVLKTGTLTATPKISKLTSTKSKTAAVTWGKVTGAKSYVVYKSTDGKKWTKAGVSTGTSFTLTGLTGGKKIYVKVLAVNAYKANSAYSASKYITVKK